MATAPVSSFSSDQSGAVCCVNSNFTVVATNSLHCHANTLDRTSSEHAINRRAKRPPYSHAKFR